MANKYTIRVAINGSETDTTVEADSASWLTKIGEVRSFEGGGSFTREANHATLSFKLRIPQNLSWAVNTVTIAVQGPAASPSSWFTSAGGGQYYRVVFHGSVNAIRGVDVGTGMIEFQAISEMQGLYERRAHTAQDNNSGPRDLTTAIETAHSLTIAGTSVVPESTDFYNLDRPAQGGAANGQWLRNVMAGTGMTLVAEWDGPITAPALRWRTDYPWFSGGNFNNITAGRPWSYIYLDHGTVWRDFVARVEVNGASGQTLSYDGWVRYPQLGNIGPRPSTQIITVADGTRYYGYGRLGSSAMRAAVSQTELSINSWIDTAAECETAAKWILRHMGEPTYLKINRMGYYPDYLWREADADPLYDPDPDNVFLDHAAVMLGDQFVSREFGNDLFDNSNLIGPDNSYGTWPTVCPPGSDRYDDLFALWNPTLTNNGVSSGQVQLQTVRTLARTWNPSSGWYVEVGLEPSETVAVADSGHGTY